MQKRMQKRMQKHMQKHMQKFLAYYNIGYLNYQIRYNLIKVYKLIIIKIEQS